MHCGMQGKVGGPSRRAWHMACGLLACLYVCVRVRVCALCLLRGPACGIPFECESLRGSSTCLTLGVAGGRPARGVRPHAHALPEADRGLGGPELDSEPGANGTRRCVCPPKPASRTASPMHRQLHAAVRAHTH